MLHFKSVASLLHDIGNHYAPPSISALLTRSEQIHSHFIRSSAVGNFCIKKSRINNSCFPSLKSVQKLIWNGIPPELRDLRKALFKWKFYDLLLQILKNDEINVDMRYIELSKHI